MEIPRDDILFFSRFCLRIYDNPCNNRRQMLWTMFDVPEEHTCSRSSVCLLGFGRLAFWFSLLTLLLHDWWWGMERGRKRTRTKMRKCGGLSGWLYNAASRHLFEWGYGYDVWMDLLFRWVGFIYWQDLAGFASWNCVLFEVRRDQCRLWSLGDMKLSIVDFSQGISLDDCCAGYLNWL